MKKYRVSLEETYNRDVIVEAEDEEQAKDIAESMCLEGKIILYNNNDYYGSLEAWNVEEADENEEITKED